MDENQQGHLGSQGMGNMNNPQALPIDVYILKVVHKHRAGWRRLLGSFSSLGVQESECLVSEIESQGR